jgi:hypothetical protein
MSTSTSLSSNFQPTQNKKQPFLVGSDLIANFITDLYLCRMLSEDEQIIHNQSFEGRGFLYFNTPDYVTDFYSFLLNQEVHNQGGLPLVLTTFLPTNAFTEEAYTSQWFMVNARLLPYKLPFPRMQVSGDEESLETNIDEKISIALPRNNAIQW